MLAVSITVGSVLATGPDKCGDPTSGDCCAANGTAGCDDTACCAAVCACDPFCCSIEWDDFCAGPNGDVPGCSALALCNVCGPPAPTGACCNALDCVLETQAGCADRGGLYQGDRTVCGVRPGAMPRIHDGLAGLSIPDNEPSAGVTHTIHVPESFVVGDVNVRLGVDHPRVGDLVVTLSHSGTTVTLVNQPGDGTDTPGLPIGCTGSDYDLVLDDEGTGGSIEARCEPNLTSPPSYRPQNPLHGFDGLGAAGNWTLTISDTAPLDFGSLRSWSLLLAEPVNACIATGACCFESRLCTRRIEEECITAGGYYVGDESACEQGSASMIESQALSLPIPDADPASGVSHSFAVHDSFSIQDVNVGVRLTHMWVGDLVIEVEHRGTSVTLVNQPGDESDTPESPFGCSNDNYDILLDDEGAGGLIETQCQSDLTSPPSFVPNNPLHAFDGLDASGVWTITVRDTALLSVGSLNGWSLELTGPADPDTCANQFVGACCDRSTGVCTEALPEPECAGTKLDWFRGSACHNIGCQPVRGACCDTGSGTCENDVRALDCAAEHLTWFENATCGEIMCAARIGACCRRDAGECLDGVAETECGGSGREWLEGATCDTLDCRPADVPAVSRWGVILVVLILLTVQRIRTRWMKAA